MGHTAGERPLRNVEGTSSYRHNGNNLKKPEPAKEAR